MEQIQLLKVEALSSLGAPNPVSTTSDPPTSHFLALGVTCFL